jgi:hypothetical protein
VTSPTRSRSATPSSSAPDTRAALKHPRTMPTADNRQGPAAGPGDPLPEDGSLPDLALYERLINDGIVAADGRGTTIDHLTARRLAIWLTTRPQEQVFAQGLTRFADTGIIGPTLKMQLRMRARSGTYTDRSQAAKLLEYCIGRGTDLGPVSQDFGRACDQMDQADVMLARLHDRARQGLGLPEQTWPETDGPRIIALAQRNPDSQTVTLILDATTANTALFAIAANADEREAHIREVEQFGQSLPEGSYGRRNRQAISARETRVAARLRAVERAYRIAIERNSTIKPPEAAAASLSPEQPADREIELE